jgi:hypothetical protein
MTRHGRDPNESGRAARATSRAMAILAMTRHGRDARATYLPGYLYSGAGICTMTRQGAWWAT